MSVRWRLREAASLADIGCGLCHWSRLLYPFLKSPARFAAVDREPQWVAQAEQVFKKSFPRIPPELFSFAQGTADAIPLPDDSFDVVTCQTVLMHAAAPLQALREMIRIARPGGLVVCVEPNNLWNYMAFTSLTADEPVDEVVRRFEFWLRYHRGMKAASQGDHTLGDLLPGLFAELGLDEIQVYQSDRVPAIFPPYEAPSQKALLEEDNRAHQAGTGPWDVAQLRRYVALGGGTPDFFQRCMGEIEKRFDREQSAIRQGKFHAACGGLMYLVSGRKPSKGVPTSAQV